MNWWVVRERGVTLYGPSPAALSAPVSQEESVQAAREHAQGWREWGYESRHRRAQAYAILTLCRALYEYTKGEQVSKRRAAEWVQARCPQWASLIGDALAWRVAWRDEDVDHEATFPETVRFVRSASDQILVGSGAVR